MAVLLQSLDSDESDKIVITEEMHEALSDDAFDLATISEEELVAVIEETGREAVDEDGAMEHVQEMLVEYTDLDEDDFEQRESDEDESLVLLEENDGINISALDEEKEGDDTSDKGVENSEKEENTDDSEDSDKDAEDIKVPEDADEDADEDLEESEETKDTDDSDVSDDAVSADDTSELDESDVSKSDEAEAEVAFDNVVETDEPVSIEKEHLDDILPGEGISDEKETVQSVDAEPQVDINEVVSAIDPTVVVTVDDQIVDAS
jgi:hypothetical protein